MKKLINRGFFRKALFLNLLMPLSVAGLSAASRPEGFPDMEAEVSVSSLREVDTLKSRTLQKLPVLTENKPETLEDLHVKTRFMPTTRRIDRGIGNLTFVYKGEVALGLSASYGTLSGTNSDFLLLMDNIDLKGSTFRINPSVGYFVSNNFCIGARFGYSRTDGHVGNISLDLGPENDMSLSLTDVALKNQMMTIGLFLRSFAGIDPKGHFGLFAELELLYNTGFSKLSYKPGEVLKYINSNNDQLELAFNTGLAIYIFPNVCTTISFGLGGFRYDKVQQKNEAGAIVGTRYATKMLWKLNLLDIRIGFNLHL